MQPIHITTFLIAVCVLPLTPCVMSAQPSAVSSPHAGVPAAHDISRFPGASIVERMAAAIHECAGAPCEVYIPAGTYKSSPISTWAKRENDGSAIGVAIPSNVCIRGAGTGHTVIEVIRSAEDPAATLFSGRSSRNVRLSDMTVTWNDSSPKYDWVSILLCRGCDSVELDHLTLEGNPNKLVNLLDSTASNVHDNQFLLRPTGYGHGDNALSFSRFDSAISLTGDAGVLRDNRFAQVGDYQTFSLLIVAQSGLYVHSNVFEAPLRSSGGNATGIESGQDNLARIPQNVKISNNTFHGASIAYGGLNGSEISGNFFDHGDIYISPQSGTSASVSGLTIADNELHFGRISIGGLETAGTSRIVITRNRVFDGNIGTGNSRAVHDIEVSYNLVRYSSNKNGIDCNACSMIRGNVVREIGQNAAGDLHAGYLIGGAVADVSDNLYIDEQHDYETGTICSVASPASTACLSSGTSRWVYLRDGQWAADWTNHTIFTEGKIFLIRSFLGPSLVELDDDIAALPGATRYRLQRSTFNAFELNGALIGRFSNNFAIAPGGYRHAAVQEDGLVRIRSLYGNVFQPYSCSGKCAIDYRAVVTASDSP